MNDPGADFIYGIADPLFHDLPGRMDDHDQRYRQAGGPVPDGWNRTEQGLWTVFTPVCGTPSGQGWKIHVSSVPGTAQSTLDDAARVLLAHGVPFKFLRSDAALRLLSGKLMSRSGSGKFITAYPPDDAVFTTLVTELAAALDGVAGPYVLSDLRIGPGPVFARYGAFTEQWCTDEEGDPVLALRTPTGELVPDERRPVFHVPAWVPVPPVLAPHLTARAEARDDDFPYRFVEALQFSNAGGIYLAEHRDTGEQVVLREARPHSGLDGAGHDAVTRLHREHRTLHHLRGLPCVPRLLGMRTVWEHHYLIEEYIEGTRLLDAVIARYPMVGRGTSAADLASYADWVRGIVSGLEAALAAIHARGLCFRDLHPGNVMVRPDDSVVLVDFEYAIGIDEDDALRVGAAGYAAPSGTTGVQADRYGLWATWLSMLFTLVEMVEQDPSKAAFLEAAAWARFGLTPGDGPQRPTTTRPRPVAGAPAGIDPFDGPGGPDWPAIRRGLVAGIHAHATPERDDRLFPADPGVFRSGGHTLAHGAAGVLLALHRCGETVPESYVDWLVRAAQRAGNHPYTGLFDGLHGAAMVLEQLGRTDAAAQTLARARAAAEPATAGLRRGRAGVALHLLRVAVRTGDDDALGAARRTAAQLDAAVRGAPADGLMLPASAGLLDGMSGAALLHLRLYRLTGEPRHLVAARTALAWELGHCVTMADGTAQVRQDERRHLLYLEGGSGGIALVAHEYLAHTPDDELATFVEAARRGCASDFVREPGLFRGRAGLLSVLGRIGGPDPDADTLASIRRLAGHGVHRDGTLLVPGAGLTRFSCDLATGSAGLLLALHAVFEGKGDLLSMLAP